MSSLTQTELLVSGDGAAPPLLDDQEPFQCYICLDLLYKPVVHSCGHVFCFWCAYRAMDGCRESQCPLCRKPFLHFPRICELLHFILMKVMPEDYHRRAQETQKMEVEGGVFSPRIPQARRIPCIDEALHATEFAHPVENGGNAKLPNADDCCPMSSSAIGGLKRLSPSLLASETVQEEAKTQNRLDREDEGRNEVSAEDLSCTSCKKFLYRPVVLHCGEVFCEPCVQKVDSLFSCPSCQYTHPEGCVRVCLNLHHYLESKFPDFVLKRKAEACNTAQVMVKEISHCKAMEEPGVIHEGAGCDGCGMCPIVGERYKCDDCPETICYDLCGGCYAKGAHYVGRFNQQHTASHRMRRVAGELVRFSGTLNLFLSNGLVIQRRHHSSQQFADANDHHHINSYL